MRWRVCRALRLRQLGLIFLLGCLAVCRGEVSPQRTMLETFYLRLEDEPLTPEAAIAPASSPHACTLTPFAPDQHRRYGRCALQLLFACGCVVALFLSGRGMRSPRRRQALRRLRGLVRGDVGVHEAMQALRELLDVPPGCSVTRLAQLLASRHAELAAACLACERRRFNGDEAEAGKALATAMRRFLWRQALPSRKMCLHGAVALVLAACCLINGRGMHLERVAEDEVRHRWQQAGQLAEAGKAEDALDMLWRLHASGVTKPELSDNLALLLSLVTTSSGSEGLCRSPQAWQLQAKLLREGAFQRQKQVIVAPQTTFYATPEGETPLKTSGRQAQVAVAPARGPRWYGRRWVQAETARGWVDRAQLIE